MVAVTALGPVVSAHISYWGGTEFIPTKVQNISIELFQKLAVAACLLHPQRKEVGNEPVEPFFHLKLT